MMGLMGWQVVRKTALRINSQQGDIRAATCRRGRYQPEDLEGEPSSSNMGTSLHLGRRVRGREGLEEGFLDRAEFPRGSRGGARLANSEYDGVLQSLSKQEEMF